ncbi:quinone oxidoreductase [Tothia fuscella]|uniref:Quinone oxidoreductase n=1 Tax=Tothia fuscella TaxID=1048955 RepID=A0A9P4P3H0_9PEZI|nr:quinone oxidoreductase [Tothia fuscella]
MTFPSTQKAIHIPAFVDVITTAKTLTKNTCTYKHAHKQNHADLQVSALPFPKTTPSTLLIRVTHISPTHVDLLYAKGLHQNNRRHAKPPFTLGMDFAGIVVKVPTATPHSNNTDFKINDKVYGSAFGAFAQFIALDSKSAGGVRRLPRGLSMRDACSIGASGATGLGSWLRAGGVKKGSWVLVTGATGGLGVMAVQIAKAMGGRVIALVGKEKQKTDMLKSIGAEVCVRYDQPGWEDQVKEATDGGEGVDIVYDSVGMIESGLKCCAYGGQVVVVGFAGRGGDIEKVRANRVLLKSAAVLGYRFGEHGRRDPEAVARIWRDFDGMVADGSIKAVVYNVKYTGLDDVSRAMLDLAERKVWGRAVITVADEDEILRDRSKL